MASYDPEYYNAPRFSPEYGEPRSRGRGCFFYGCVFASALGLFAIIALGVMAFVGYRLVNRFVTEWTSTTPVELPKVQISDDERRSVRERVEAFRKAVNEGTATDPLVLSGDDLNALIEENPTFKDTIYARIEGDKLKAQVSIPLDRFKIGMVRGRYLNGEAELKASLSSGVLVVNLDTLEVNGKRPPEKFLQSLRQQNLAKDAYDNPKNAEMLSRFESMTIKDGKIILTPRRRQASLPVPAGSRSPVELPGPPDDETLHGGQEHKAAASQK
jgi:hypothetical protein